MAISKTQPMREAEIELVDAMNAAQDDVTALREASNELSSTLEETNTVVGQLNAEIGQEIDNRIAADSTLSNRLDAAEESITAFPIFEFGATEGEELQAGTSVGVDIEFTAAKEAIPHVLISVESDETEGYIAECSGVISNITLDGFSVRLHNDSADTATIIINWLAIGE